MKENMYAAITGIPAGFKAFVGAMQERLEARYPDCEVRAVQTDKNNGVRLTGIVIMQDGENVTPNIYMEGFYREYLDGRRMEDIEADAARLYEGCRIKGGLSLPDMTDFEAVRGLICFKPVNRERNREKLKSMPHRDFLDLAIVYFVPVTIGGEKSGTITVTDHMFRLWQTDEETLYGYALENTRRLYPVILQSLEDVIRDVMGDDAPEGLFPERDGIPAVPLYVLRCNKGDMSSAAAILYGDILREFGQEHGNFYILPSSIRENNMFRVMDYKNVYDYAEKEYGLKKTTCCNFISIIENYAERDENGEVIESIADCYRNYSASQLVAMLGMNEDMRQQVSPDMSVRAINRLKKGEPEQGTVAASPAPVEEPAPVQEPEKEPDLEKEAENPAAEEEAVSDDTVHEEGQETGEMQEAESPGTAEVSAARLEEPEDTETENHGDDAEGHTLEAANSEGDTLVEIDSYTDYQSMADELDLLMRNVFAEDASVRVKIVCVQG